MKLWEDIDELAKAIKDFEKDEIDAKHLSRAIETEIQDPSLEALGKITKAIALLNGHAPEILNNSSIPSLIPDYLEALDPPINKRKATKQILNKLKSITGLGQENLDQIADKIKTLGHRSKPGPKISAKPKPKISAKPKPEKSSKVDPELYQRLKSKMQERMPEIANPSAPKPDTQDKTLAAAMPQVRADFEKARALKNKAKPQFAPKPTKETPMPDQPVRPMASRLKKSTNYPMAQVMYTLGDMAVVRVMGEIDRNGQRIKKLSFVQVPLEEVNRARKTGNLEGELWQYVREHYYLSYLNRIRQRLKKSGIGDEALSNPNKLREYLNNLPPEDEAYNDLRALKKTYTKQFSDNSLDAVRRLHSATAEDPNPENFTEYLRTYIGRTPEESLLKAVDRMSRVKPSPVDKTISKYILMMGSDQKDRFLDSLEKVIRSRKPFNKGNIRKYLNSVWRRKTRGTPALSESAQHNDLIIESEITHDFRAFLMEAFPMKTRNEKGATFSPDDYKLAERGLLYSLMVGALRSNPKTILNFARKFGILEPRDDVQEFETQQDVETEPPNQNLEYEAPDAAYDAEMLGQDVEKFSKMLQDPNTASQLYAQVPEQYQNYVYELASDPTSFLAGLNEDPKNPRHNTLKWVEKALAGVGLRGTKVDQNRARRAAQQARISKLEKTKNYRKNPLQTLQRNALLRRQAKQAQTPQESRNFDDALSKVLVEYDILPDRIINLEPHRDRYIKSKSFNNLEESRISAHRLASSAIDTYIDNNNPQLLNLVIEDATKAFKNYSETLIESGLTDLIYLPNENEDLLSELVRYSKLTCSPKTEQGWKSLIEYHKNPQKSTRQMKNNLMWIRGPSKIN